MRTTLQIAAFAAVPLLALLGCPSDGPAKSSAKAEVAKSEPAAKKPEAAKTTVAGDVRQATLVVSGMHWVNGWGNKVARALEGTDGVSKVTRKGDTFTIDYGTGCDTDKLRGVIKDLGYTSKLQ